MAKQEIISAVAETAYTVSIYTSDTKTYTAITTILGGDRATYADAEAALVALTKMATEADGAVPVLIASVTAIMLTDVTVSHIDAVAPGAHGYTISTVGIRGVEGTDGKKRNGLTGIAVYPAHSVDSVLEHAAGKAYLTRLMHKEMGLVMFRRVRDIVGDSLDVIAQYAQAMPVTLDDFLVRATQSGGASVNAFTSGWGTFRKILLANPGMAELVATLPDKANMAKCLQSAEYARVLSPQSAIHEANGIYARLGAVMVNMIRQDQADAAATGEVPDFEGDPALIDGWLANRDEYVIAAAPAVVKDIKADFSAFGF